MIEFKNVKIFTDDIEPQAIDQVAKIANTGLFPNPIRIMPDGHSGKGSVIGFTTKIIDKVVPNIVGVDIACGMLVVELGKVDIDFSKLDTVIRKTIPSGMNVNENNKDLKEWKVNLRELRCYDQLKKLDWLENSLGTLGGGNHFIEIDGDSDGNYYFVVHTGSRNLGKQIAEIYQNKAIHNIHKVDNSKIIEKLKREGRQSEIEETLKALRQAPKIPDELCYLEGQDMEDYLRDVQIATKFANYNRQCIATKVLKKMGFIRKNLKEKEFFTTLHNYISEDGMIRKGAIYAGDVRVLIPLNMRDGCIIGHGKSNEDWNYSAPHGAGRKMSRAKAKKMISMDDYRETMKGIWTTSVDESTIDESPFAYKPSEEIIELVKDTVEIEKIIKPVYNFKASE